MSKWFLVLPWLLVLSYGAYGALKDYQKFQELKGTENQQMSDIQSGLQDVAAQFPWEVKIIDDQFQTQEERTTIQSGVDKFTSASRSLRGRIGRLSSIKFFPRSAARLREASELLEKEEDLLSSMFTTKLDLLRTQEAITRLPSTVEYYRQRKDYYAGRLDLPNWLAAQKALAQSETALNFLEDQLASLESSLEYLRRQSDSVSSLLSASADELESALAAERNINYWDYLQSRISTFDLPQNLKEFFRGGG